MGAYQLVSALTALVSFYEWLVVIWCVLSWFPMREGGLLYDVATVINRLVQPFVGLFRRLIPPLGGIDFSPIVALFVLGVVERFVVQLIYGLA